MSNQDSPIQKLPLPEWIQERIQNCHRIAASKSGSDRDDWLEDAKYFSEILRELAQAQERRRYIPGNLASEACNAAYNRACHTNKKAADELRPAFLGMLEAMLRVLADASAQPSIESDALCTMLKEALCPMGRCAGGVTYLTGEEPRPCEWCERRAQLTKGPQATAQPSIESQAPLTIPDFLRNQDNLRAEKAETNATRSCNACEWTGPENETVHFKHWPDNLLCHECHETTELSTASPQSEPSP